MLPKHAHDNIIQESVTGAGVTTEKFSIHSGSVMVSIFVRSISGTLDIKVYTYGNDIDEKLQIIEFPSLSAASTQLLLRKSSLSLNKVVIEATYTDACDYTVLARGIESADSTVSISGANTAQASNATVTNVAAKVLPSSLDNRNGISIRNYSDSVTMYIGYTEAEATVANGFPLDPKESIPIDVEAGVDVWAVTANGTVDVRIMQAGS